MPTTGRILVALDRSRAAAAALHEAVRIAAWDRAEIVVLHVIDAPSAPEDDAPAGVVGLGDLGEFAPHEEADVWAALAEFRKLAAPALAGSPDAQILVRVGHPGAEIQTCLRELKARWLVMGATGDSAAGASLGALAARCVRSAPARVLVVRKPQAGPFARVVAAIDDSVAPVVLDEAIRIARQDQARLDILHVETGPVAPPGVAAIAARTRSRQRALERIDAFLEPYAHELRFLHSERHVIERAEPQTGIIDFVRRTGSDLVILGTQGRGAGQSPPPATPAERIVRDSPCCVLVIPLLRSRRRRASGPRARVPARSKKEFA